MRKVIIVECQNDLPEYELNERLEELGPEWTIVSAKTSMAVLKPEPYAQVLYTTTVVVEKK